MFSTLTVWEGRDMICVIDTVRKLRSAIDKADTVYIQVRFGVVKSWVKIRKSEARKMLRGAPGSETAQDWQMQEGDISATATFGTFTENGNLYMG